MEDTQGGVFASGTARGYRRPRFGSRSALTLGSGTSNSRSFETGAERVRRPGTGSSDSGLLAGLPVNRPAFRTATSMLPGMRSTAALSLTSVAAGDARNDVAGPRCVSRNCGPDHSTDQTTQHGAERRPGSILRFVILLSEAGIHPTEQPH